MSRVKERSRVRQSIRSFKREVEKQFQDFVNKDYVDPLLAEAVIIGIDGLVALQRQLNAMSVEVDERRLLQRATQRTSAKK